MRDTEVITFNFEGQGEVKFTIARCRELCPKETVALEAATDTMTAARERQDMQALGEEVPKLGGCSTN
jgi:hypothetical protein